MDSSKFKDLIRRLSFLGNYSSLIIPIIIILAAMLLFIPSQLMSSRLKERMENESVSIGRRVQSLVQSAVSRNQWEVEQEYQQAYERDANRTVLLAKQTTRRQLLSYRIFPEPKETSVLIFKRFGQHFRDGIEKLIAQADAHDCPTTAELREALHGSSLPSSFSRRGSLDMRRLSEVDSAITEELCRERAQSSRVYANPMNLSGYEFWEEYEYEGMNAAVEDCWYWQLAYWIIEDVFDTIDVLNSGSNSVFTSPVKRLLNVDFVVGSRVSGGFARKATDVRPSYVPSIEGLPIEPYTGRFCNEDVDVVHFNVSVVVSTKAVMPFMQKLCSAKEHKFTGFSGNEQQQVFKHNQITVLESNVSSIDRTDTNHNLYRYGEDAVVELNLICEYIFNKSGYDEIKPELIKETLMNE